jgi:hypothetical protein
MDMTPGATADANADVSFSDNSKDAGDASREADLNEPMDDASMDLPTDAFDDAMRGDVGGDTSEASLCSCWNGPMRRRRYPDLRERRVDEARRVSLGSNLLLAARSGWRAGLSSRVPVSGLQNFLRSFSSMRRTSS